MPDGRPDCGLWKKKEINCPIINNTICWPKEKAAQEKASNPKPPCDEEGSIEKTQFKEYPPPDA